MNKAQHRIAAVVAACRPMLSAPIDSYHSTSISVLVFDSKADPHVYATLITALCSEGFKPATTMSSLLVDKDGYGALCEIEPTRIRLEVHSI